MKHVNPWVAIPVLVATLAGGVVGALVTQVSCAPGSCIPAAVGIGLLSAALAFAGVGVVVILALRSVAEWREQQPGAPAKGRSDAGPPTC